MVADRVLDDRSKLILLIWMLRARRAAKSHALTIPYYRSLDQRFTFINVFLAITVLGISSVAPLFENHRTVFSYAIPIAAILNVLLSALQYIRDYGVKATHHERASGLYARVMRELEQIMMSESVSEEKIISVRNQLDLLGATSAYPPEKLRDQPKTLSDKIIALEAVLDGMPGINPMDPPTP